MMDWALLVGGTVSGFIIKHQYTLSAIDNWNDEFADLDKSGDVSIIMPTLNEAVLIRDSLASLEKQNIRQTFPDRFELIVADSNSQDGTGEIAKQYTDKVILTPLGKLNSIDVAIREAKGRVIVATDGDSLYGVNFLNLLLKHFEKRDVVAVSGSEMPVNSPLIPTMISLWFEWIGCAIHPRLQGRGCYAEGTEVLTKSGWTKISAVGLNDEICTLNPSTHLIEFQKLLRKFVYDYSERLIRINTRNKAIDLLVTPEHKFFVERYTRRENRYRPMFVEAQDLIDNDKIPRSGIWIGQDNQFFTIPACSRKSYGKKAEKIKRVSNQGLKQREIAKFVGCHKNYVWRVLNGKSPNPMEFPPMRVEMKDWLAFFGIWLAEGWTSGSQGSPAPTKYNRYLTGIAQKSVKTRAEIRRLLDRLPWNWFEDSEKREFLISNKQLWSYLKEFGNKYQKFIPNEVKALPPKLLKILLEWMIKGDGHKEQSGVKKDGRWRRGCVRYWTSSSKLADDLQEIALKVNLNARIVCIPSGKGGMIRGRRFKSKEVFELRFRRQPYFRFRKYYISRECYNGKVYSVEVPNHIMYVRYNGIPIWCGNSAYYKDAYHAVGGFDLTVDQTNLLEMLKEEEWGFRKRLQQVGTYVYEPRAVVFSQARRFMCLHPLNEVCEDPLCSYCHAIREHQRF